MVYILKYIIVLNSTYPCSASKKTKHKETSIIPILFSFLISLTNSINKTAKRGGKNRYIPLNALYNKYMATYTNGAKEFL